jgi:hypothetical protein
VSYNSPWFLADASQSAHGFAWAALLPTLSATPAVSPLLQAAGHDGRLLRPDSDEER